MNPKQIGNFYFETPVCRTSAISGPVRPVPVFVSDPETAIDDFNQDFVGGVIRSVPERDAAKLLVRMIPKWDEVQVMSNLKTLGTSYEEIADYGKRPLIAESDVNLALAEALQQRGFISQFKNDEKGIRIITKRKNPSE